MPSGPPMRLHEIALAPNEAPPDRSSGPGVLAWRAENHKLRPRRLRRKSPPARREDDEQESLGSEGAPIHPAARLAAPILCSVDNAPRFLSQSGSSMHSLLASVADNRVMDERE